MLALASVVVALSVRAGGIGLSGGMTTPTDARSSVSGALSPECDPRSEACNAPRWCETTGTLVGPFSGYCPIGPTNYPPPWDDDE